MRVNVADVFLRNWSRGYTDIFLKYFHTFSFWCALNGSKYNAEQWLVHNVCIKQIQDPRGGQIANHITLRELVMSKAWNLFNIIDNIGCGTFVNRKIQIRKDVNGFIENILGQTLRSCRTCVNEPPCQWNSTGNFWQWIHLFLCFKEISARCTLIMLTIPLVCVQSFFFIIVCKFSNSLLYLNWTATKPQCDKRHYLYCFNFIW